MNQHPRTPLSTGDDRLLGFEARWWRSPGAKRQAIATELKLSETAYYQRLALLLDDPAALEAHPLTVNRLRRARDRRRSWRVSRE